MRSPDLEPVELLDPRAGEALLEVAHASIEHGLRSGAALAVDPRRYPEALRAERATFVTLHRLGELRGCLGELEAIRPLVASVAHHAFAAAFRDPRFPPLTASELDGLEAHVSVLSPLEELAVRDEEDLLAVLQPGHDGLLIDDGLHRATFLPAVWESLSEPHAFLRELKRKAGVPETGWPPGLRVWRYSAQSVPAG
jgi:AmmeMemoRadiSam system protein A